MARHPAPPGCSGGARAAVQGSGLQAAARRRGSASSQVPSARWHRGRAPPSPRPSTSPESRRTGQAGPVTRPHWARRQRARREHPGLQFPAGSTQAFPERAKPRLPREAPLGERAFAGTALPGQPALGCHPTPTFPSGSGRKDARCVQPERRDSCPKQKASPMSPQKHHNQTSSQVSPCPSAAHPESGERGRRCPRSGPRSAPRRRQMNLQPVEAWGLVQTRCPPPPLGRREGEGERSSRVREEANR